MAKLIRKPDKMPGIAPGSMGSPGQGSFGRGGRSPGRMSQGPNGMSPGMPGSTPGTPGGPLEVGKESVRAQTVDGEASFYSSIIWLHKLLAPNTYKLGLLQTLGC